MLARLSAFIVWSLVAAITVFWGLRLLVQAPTAPSYTVAVGDAGAVRGDLARLFGTKPVAPVVMAAAPQASSRFRLLGVVASNGQPTGGSPSSQGVALIAVDDQIPKAYAVGARIDADMVLQAVGLRSASIASSQAGPPTITLEMPPLAAVATGRLPIGNIGNNIANTGGNVGGAQVFHPTTAPVPQYVPPAFKPYVLTAPVPQGPPAQAR